MSNKSDQYVIYLKTVFSFLVLQTQDITKIGAAGMNEPPFFPQPLYSLRKGDNSNGLQQLWTAALSKVSDLISVIELVVMKPNESNN